MRTFLIAVAMLLASPAPLCLALCGEMAGEARAHAEARHAVPPCHDSGPAGSSEQASICERCGETSLFVPSREQDAPPFAMAVDTLATSEPAPSGIEVRRTPLARAPPDQHLSPYLRNNPPLLN